MQLNFVIFKHVLNRRFLFCMTGNCTGRDSEMHRIMKQFDHISNDLGNVGIDMLYSFFPFLRFLPLSYSQKIKEWFKLKQQFIGTLEKQAVHDAGKKGIYHSLKKITQEKDSHGQQWFTDVNVHCLLINVVTGGYLTTRGALLSLIQILAKRPELQRAMQDEIDSVTGTTREPALADRHQCHLVEAVTLETLRYISHGVITPHCTSQATEILGVPVGKNTPILLNFWTIHHNAEEWQEPFSFRPERFLDKDGSLLPSTDPVRKRMIVFGLGKRSCVGEAFARARMFLFVATVLQSFTITEPDDADLSDLLPREMETGHILQPKPYKVRFILREK
ncbi:steroid 17-alpha-hydroxylase/17,20 lyase-like isoform X2 [Ostrea edulis]|uniref:steroid 17-alpha-hydroxylase/17,20 lyase-like isoform X2 n=1 Tax=Ostrea edulis TaxID=37623 RepID=UPI0024AF01B2|nr:steroid 17-alpha-hydroxylase/17,20 lyase-like isoform X2 [Ostrea edulis]